MNLREAQKWVESEFFQEFTSQERGILARYIIEKVSGFRSHSWWNEHLTYEMNSAQILEITQISNRVAGGEPLQYVLGEAWFLGRSYVVSPSVLIPRPETEELCEIILKSLSGAFAGTILEIGTGSGCIAISLSLGLRLCRVLATDISPGALEIAIRNAEHLDARVELIENNIHKGLPVWLQDVDVIVSNPPYIPPENIREMDRNVVAYEPHIALFTPSGDALLFYRSIASEGNRILRPGGRIWFEVHEDYADLVGAMLSDYLYTNIEILKDYHGRKRFVCGQKPR